MEIIPKKKYEIIHRNANCPGSKVHFVLHMLSSYIAAAIESYLATLAHLLRG